MQKEKNMNLTVKTVPIIMHQKNECGWLKAANKSNVVAVSKTA